MNTITIFLLVAFPYTGYYGAVPTIIERFATAEDCYKLRDEMRLMAANNKVGTAHFLNCIQTRVADVKH